MPGDLVAIDGPAASGKSTVSRRVAAAMNSLYVDSGALYRAVTWRAMKHGVEEGDREGLLASLHEMQLEFFVRDGAVCFLVDGSDPGVEIRTESVNRRVSEVAATPQVRECVVDWLRGMDRFGNLVVEGRDIGSVVFPAAPHKFYLDADPEERARRRHREFVERNETSNVESVRDSQSRRDRLDSQRKTAPLVVADGAQIIDTTELDIDVVVAMVLERVR